MPKRLARLIPVAAVLVLVVAIAPALPGCSDEEPVRIETRTLSVELDEFRIIPEDAIVRPGRLRITATNVGTLTHNLKVVRLNRRDREARPTELGGTATAQPGDTVSYTFENIKPGEYRMLCSISNHDDLGQYGELIVTERQEQ